MARAWSKRPRPCEHDPDRHRRALGAAMSPESEFIQAEIAEVRKIVETECWLEGERRGMPVDPRDKMIQKRVAEIILSGVGAQLRQSMHRHSSTP